MARQVLPIVGAAITTYFGMGPQLGWAIGSIVGNVVDPVVNKGPSIGDLAQQTSQEGVPRPIVFGVSPPMGGNIILCSDPKIVTKRERQGKGGPINETQHVYRTYAIGVCEGPINAFLRVWRNGNLVYDVRPGHKQVQDAAFIKYARFFLGGWSQAQSPDLVAVKGADDTPFFRATAYLVMANEDLTDLRGAVPQYAFQVLRCEGTVLTSRPYPIESNSSIEASFDNILPAINETVGKMGRFDAQFTFDGIDVVSTRVAENQELGKFVPDFSLDAVDIVVTRVAEDQELGTIIANFSLDAATVVTARVVLNQTQVSLMTTDFSFDSVEVV